VAPSRAGCDPSRELEGTVRTSVVGAWEPYTGGTVGTTTELAEFVRDAVIAGDMIIFGDECLAETDALIAAGR
jgi:hypothetical protein